MNKLTIIILLCGFVAVPVWGQCKVKGRIIGRDLEAIGVASVKVYGPGSGPVGFTESDSTGNFLVDVPVAGTYRLEIEAQGYPTLQMNRLELRKGILDLTEVDMLRRVKVQDDLGRIHYEYRDTTRIKGLRNLIGKRDY